MRGEFNQRTEYTNGQMTISKWIAELGFPHDLEVEFHPYRVDIYIKEAHVAIEFDGPRHYKKKDQKRDLVLWEKYRLAVHRIKILYPKRDIVNGIIFFIAENIETSSQRENFGGLYC